MFVGLKAETFPWLWAGLCFLPACNNCPCYQIYPNAELKDLIGFFPWPDSVIFGLWCVCWVPQRELVSAMWQIQQNYLLVPSSPAVVSFIIWVRLLFIQTFTEILHNDYLYKYFIFIFINLDIYKYVFIYIYLKSKAGTAENTVSKIPNAAWSRNSVLKPRNL